MFGAASLDPFPYHFTCRADGTQNEPVADEFIAADHVAYVTGLHAALAMMSDRLRPLIDRIGAEIGDVVGKRGFGLVGRRLLAGARHLAIGRDMTGHMTVTIVYNDAFGARAALSLRLAVERRADIAP